jgi:RNA polymerase sigma-70 factor (ECF subfamily)
MAYTTRKSMLDAMRRNEDEAWREFLDFYAPLINLRANDFQLTPREADELRQDLCVNMFARNGLANYDASKGRFRDYLRAIISNCAIDILRQRPSSVEAPEPAVPPDDDERFELEWRQNLLEKALAEVQSRCDDLTFMAFQLHAQQGKPAKEVAAALKIAEQKVYLASSRITQRLKDAVQRIERELGE